MPVISHSWNDNRRRSASFMWEAQRELAAASHLSRRWSLWAPAWSSCRRGIRGAAALPSWRGAQRGGRGTPAWSPAEGRGCLAPTSAGGRWAGCPEPSTAGREKSGTARRADGETWGRRGPVRDPLGHGGHTVTRTSNAINHNKRLRFYQILFWIFKALPIVTYFSNYNLFLIEKLTNGP